MRRKNIFTKQTKIINIENSICQKIQIELFSKNPLDNYYIMHVRNSDGSGYDWDSSSPLGCVSILSDGTKSYPEIKGYSVNSEENSNIANHEMLNFLHELYTDIDFANEYINRHIDEIFLGLYSFEFFATRFAKTYPDKVISWEHVKNKFNI